MKFCLIFATSVMSIILSMCIYPVSGIDNVLTPAEKLAREKAEEEVRLYNIEALKGNWGDDPAVDFDMNDDEI